MKSCDGILGLILGHDFQSFVVKYEPPAHITGLTLNGANAAHALEALANQTYNVRCTRCGQEPD